MNLKALVFSIFLFPLLVQAQSIPHKCGIDAQAAAAIKQRLMANRSLFTPQQLANIKGQKTTTYIPITIHNVANSNGEGRTEESVILGFLCGLNSIYASQNVKFFLHSPIQNVTNNFVDANAFTNSARSQMRTMGVTGTLNLIIGRSSFNRSASYYSPSGDYVFLLQQMLSSAAKTEAHEIGHFFSLPHTFNGWEGVDVENDYGGGSAPSILGFSRVEAAARTGSQANCATAADGFCDTEADYYSGRKPCPYVPTVTDPHGQAIDPDETLLMSYASDNCVSVFSTEQKNAIAIDIAARSWVSNTPSSTIVINTIPSAVSPLNNTLLGPISNSTVLLDWTTEVGATWYYLEVYGTNFFGFANTSDVIYKGLLYNGGSSFNLPTSNLVAGRSYAWRVKALNSVSTCAAFSRYYKFEASSTITSIKDLPLSQQMTMKVASNPITTSYIPFSIYSAEDLVGSIRVYAIDGKEVLTLAKQNILQGESLIQLPAADLANGIYIAVLATERGFLQQKIVVQR